MGFPFFDVRSAYCNCNFISVVYLPLLSSGTCPSRNRPSRVFSTPGLSLSRLLVFFVRRRAPLTLSTLGMPGSFSYTITTLRSCHFTSFPGSRKGALPGLVLGRIPKKRALAPPYSVTFPVAGTPGLLTSRKLCNWRAIFHWHHCPSQMQNLFPFNATL